MTVSALSACPPTTADIGTWCLEESPYPLKTQQIGQNNYFWAAQTCVEHGGYLPTAGNPRTGEPNPVPLPAVPQPATLQYVTVYSNGQKGGFAGSEPVSQPENFRCAYEKAPGANRTENG
jgi:hypothetical protein